MADNHKCNQIEKITRIDTELQDVRCLQSLLLKILVTALITSVITLLDTCFMLIKK